MKRTWVKVICITLALALCGAGVALAAKKAEKEIDVSKALIDSYELLAKQKYAQAEKLLNAVLAKDPGNPLALNNLSAVMVGMKKFDKADTYLNQALPKAKGYMVQANRVRTVGNICMAFKPVSGGTGNQDLGELVQFNINMVEAKMAAEKAGAGAGYPGAK